VKRRRNLPLWLRLLVRRLRSPEGKLAPLAVISIAVSVALATGLEMASRSALRHLKITAEAIVGSAEIEVTAGDVGLPEEILEIVRATPGVQAASPLISLKLRLIDQALSLNLIGVDLLAEEQVRETAIERNGIQIRDPLRLLATPNSVIATEALLERVGLASRYREGELTELRVRANGVDRRLVVQGLLRPVGIAAAYSGQIVLMDVYSAQELGGRPGLFDRIDVVPQRNVNTAELLASLGARLAGVATVQRASGTAGMAEDLLQMVRRSALMLAAVAALVACLLTYATTAQWVERQKRQLATLRAVGMEAHRVRRMILGEVLALSLLGTAGGLLGGVVISPALLATLSSFLKVARVDELAGVELHLSTLWVALAVGLVAGISGSLLPAHRAARRFTLDSLDLEFSTTTRGSLRSTWVGSAILGAFLLSTSVPLRDGVDAAMTRVGILFLLGPLSILALAPTLSRSLQAWLGVMKHGWPSIGHLVTRFFQARPWTFAVALTAISTLVGALVAVFLLIATLNAAFARWTESRFPNGAILITAEPMAFAGGGEVLRQGALDLIRTTPGVIAVDERYRASASVIYRGQRVLLHAQSMDVVAKYGDLSSVGRPTAELARDLHNGAVAVSTGFAKTFSIESGDELELDTPNGKRSFVVAGIYEDFGDARGSIIMDLRSFDSSWKRAGASSVLIWTDRNTEAVLAEIRHRAGELHDLYFFDLAELAEATHRQSDVFTSTLHVLGAFLSSLGAIGVMILLAGIVADRRRDLAVLRAAGAEPSQLLTVVLLDAFVLGILGVVCGVGLGFASAVPATDILRESYGWVLEQQWVAPELPVIVAGAVVSSVLGALVPARMAQRTNADVALGPE
jgi:putative ABC transport system permease protein